MWDHLSVLTLYHILWYFLLYSFVGWCLEVAFCSVNTGKFVNRGFLNGPVCPIYGFGGVCVIVMLTPLENSLLLLYIGSVAICSLLELVAGFLLKKLFHTTWWDYSNQPFNVGGYICLKFSLLWGIACIVLMKAVHPAISGLVDLLPKTLGWVLLVLLYLLIFVDLTVTVAAVRKLNRDLGELSRIASSIHSGSELMAEKIGNSAISASLKIDELHLDERRDELAARLEAEQVKLSNSAESKKEQMEKALDPAALRARFRAIATKRSFVRERLLKAFPGMRHTHFDDALTEMRAFLKDKFSQIGAKSDGSGSAAENETTGEDVTDDFKE